MIIFSILAHNLKHFLEIPKIAKFVYLMMFSSQTTFRIANKWQKFELQRRCFCASHTTISGPPFDRVLPFDNLLLHAQICSFSPNSFFRIFFYHLCGVLVWILNELKCPRKCSLWVYSVKTWFWDWCVSAGANHWIPRQMLLFCMFAALLLQGVMGRHASSSFDHSSEIEFGVLLQRRSPFLREPQLITISSSKNQDSCIR